MEGLNVMIPTFVKSVNFSKICRFQLRNHRIHLKNHKICKTMVFIKIHRFWSKKPQKPPQNPQNLHGNLQISLKIHRFWQKCADFSDFYGFPGRNPWILPKSSLMPEISTGKHPWPNKRPVAWKGNPIFI